MYVPRNRLVFPGGQPGFDPTHPAAKGIVPGLGWSWIPYAPGVGINLVEGRKSATSGTGTGPAARVFDGLAGPMLVCPNLTDSSNFSGQAAVVTALETFAAIVKFPAAIGVGVPVIGNAGAEGLGITSGLALSLSTTAASNNSSVAITTGVPYLCIISADMTGFFGSSIVNFVAVNLANGSVRWQVNQGGAGPNVGPGTATGTANISNVNPALQGGSVGAAMYAPTMMGIGEMLRWAADPFSFWYPQRAAAIVGAGAAAYVPYNPWPQLGPTLAQ